MECQKKLKILWTKGIEYVKDCGAEIVEISLPHTKYALVSLLYSGTC